MNNVDIAMTINAGPAAIYRHLTDAARLEIWLAEHAAVDLDAGHYAFWGRYTPGNPDQATGTHKITNAEPNKKLAYQWQLENTLTEVVFQLYPNGDGTRLYLSHRDVEDGSHVRAAWTMEDFWLLSLENLRRAVDGKPAEARVDFSVPLTGDITYTLEIDADPERVFTVLLGPSQLERWIASKAIVDPRVDGMFDLGWGAGPIKIVELAENEKLAYAWDEGNAENPKPTVVTWTLEASGGKTRLTLVHSGFAPDESTDGLKAGWRNFINWVRSLAEYGDTWEPPVKQMPEAMYRYYAAVMAQAQGKYFQTA